MAYNLPVLTLHLSEMIVGKFCFQNHYENFENYIYLEERITYEKKYSVSGKNKNLVKQKSQL